MAFVLTFVVVWLVAGLAVNVWLGAVWGGLSVILRWV